MFYVPRPPPTVGGVSWNGEAALPLPNCPFLSIHFLFDSTSIRLLQLVCGGTASGAPSCTHTVTAAADTQRRIHTDIFIGGSAKAEHMMNIMAKAEHTIKQPAREKLTNNVDPQSLPLCRRRCCSQTQQQLPLCVVTSLTPLLPAPPPPLLLLLLLSEGPRRKSGENVWKNERSSKTGETMMNETGEQKEHGKWLDDDIHIYISVCVWVCLCVRTDVVLARAAEGGDGRGRTEQGRSGAECGATVCLSLWPFGLRIRR